MNSRMPQPGMPNVGIASPPIGNRMPTPPGMPGNQVPQPNFDTPPMGGASGPNTGNVLRTQLEQPGGIRPGGGVGVNVDNKSELQKHLGINQVGNTQQGPGGESLLLKQLGKQTTSDPTPDMINQVAPSLANKIPNDSLHPIHPNNQKQQQQPGIKQEAEDIKPDMIKNEIKSEPMDHSSDNSNNAGGGNSTNSGGNNSDIKPANIKNEIKNENNKADVKPVVKREAVKVTFSTAEMVAALEPPLMKLFNLEPESGPFRYSVDPIALNIPDYFDIIKNPMDMTEIKRKLNAGEYKDPWEYIDDIWLMFENAWVYNRKTSRVYKYCSKVM